jgi:hypothetical protein
MTKTLRDGMIAHRALIAALKDGLRASCENDDRFIQDRLSTSNRLDMAEICATCPVFDLCDDYRRSQPYEKLAGFYAGYLVRSPVDHLNQPPTESENTMPQISLLQDAS